MAKVALERVSRRFGAAIAIADITFEVPDGAFWVLVGPSGCGKSTILRTIAGLEQATEGTIYIGDRQVNGVPARQRDVAMVFQNYALYPHMTVAENLAFGLKMRQAEPGMIRDRIETVAQSLNIAHLLDRKPRQLSGGQQQRVALGRAIAREPQVFLLDEPLSNLDAQLRDDTRAELKQLHQNVGITTIYVTHDQVEAMTLADKIVVLDRGSIQQIGEPQAIYANPANQMVASFMGNPPMNLFYSAYEAGKFFIEGQSIPCPERLQPVVQSHANSRYTLGIRPEQVQVVAETEAFHLKSVVTLIEPLGRETLVKVELPSTTGATTPMLNLIAPAAFPLQPGDRLFLRVDLEQLFLFDASTGERLD